TRNIFPAHGEREAMFQGVTQQDRTARGRRTFYNADLRVSRNVGVLEVGLNDPGPLRVRVDDVVNATVVLHWRGLCLKLGRTNVPTRHERQGMGPIGIS